jgi:2-polyprenyl-3-methyl-5-hydroxy-6-metoxy-1,4-benzoquinol methylase
MSEYQGKELELFEHAENWKRYFASHMKPYLKGSVLEVGAGIGGTTKFLCDGNQTSWTCLDPDERQVSQINSLINSKELPTYCKAIRGTLKEHTAQELYDAVLYIDVIEHIENDKDELTLATQFLKPGGVLIILAPAHQCLYSEFDKVIGHYRRYSMLTLRAIIPASMTERKLFYIDSAGVLASLVNKFFLKRSYPTKKQIYFWDKVLIPISRKLDFLTHRISGKSLISISERIV